MKSVFRFCLILAAVLLVSAPAVVISRAQTSACLSGLQAADCDLLTAASQGSINSTMMDYSLALKVSGVEGVQSGDSTLHDVSLNVTGNGPFSLDRSKLPASFSPTDSSALTAAAAAFTLGNNTKLDLTSGPSAQSTAIAFRLVDDKLYWMSSDASMYPDSQKDQVGKWLVVDPSQLSSMSGFSGTLGNVAMGNAMTSGTGAAQMQAMIQQFMAAPGFVTATRSDANDEATFTINVDVATLLKSPQFKPVLTSIMSGFSGHPDGAQMDDNQLNMMLGLITPYFDNLKITITDVVGMTDKLVHGIGFHLSLNLTAQQLQTLGVLSGGGSLSGMPDFINPVTADINFMVKLSNLNQPITLQAPADAVPVQLNSSTSDASTPEPAATSAQ